MNKVNGYKLPVFPIGARLILNGLRALDGYLHLVSREFLL